MYICNEIINKIYRIWITAYQLAEAIDTPNPADESLRGAELRFCRGIRSAKPACLEPAVYISKMCHLCPACSLCTRG